MQDWLYGAADLLASEYGWSYRDIMFNTYPDDFFLLQRQIRLRRIDEYLMQSAIVANPHKEPKDAEEFIDDLLSERRFMSGEEEKPMEMDRKAVEAFKDFLGSKSKMIKVRQSDEV